jgi:hypothetical protein
MELTIWELDEPLGTCMLEDGKLVVHSKGHAELIEDLIETEYAINGRDLNWADFFHILPTLLRGYISATFPRRKGLPLPDWAPRWSGKFHRRPPLNAVQRAS